MNRLQNYAEAARAVGASCFRPNSDAPKNMHTMMHARNAARALLVAVAGSRPI